jgi:hypothetical protein
MNKIFLAFLILFSNGTKTDDDITIEEAFSSCSKKPITTGNLFVCFTSLTGSLALGVIGGAILSKAYGFAKQLTIHLKTQLFMRDFVKQLEEFAANKSVATKLQDIEGFEETDLWRSFNIISELDESLRKYNKKTDFNMTLGDLISLGSDLKSKADRIVAAKAASASTLIDNLGKLQSLALDAKNELKWIFDRSRKINDAFIIDDAAEINRLKELFKGLKMKVSFDSDPETTETTKFSTDISDLNTLVDDFLKKISPPRATTATIKLDDIKDLFKKWNLKFKAFTDSNDFTTIISLLGPGSKTKKLDENLSALLLKFVGEKAMAKTRNLAGDKAKPNIKKLSNTTAEEYQEIINTIANPSYKVLLKSEAMNSKYVSVMRQLVAKNIANFKDGTETKLITLAEDSVITPEDQLEMLLNNNSEVNLTKILRTEAFINLFQDYVQKKLITASFFDKEIKVDGGSSLTIYDLVRSQDTPTYKSFKALIKANDIDLSRAKIIFKAKELKTLAAQEQEAKALITAKGQKEVKAAVKEQKAQKSVFVGRAAYKSSELAAAAQRVAAQRVAAQRLATQRLATQRLATQRLATQRLEGQRLAAQILATAAKQQ